MVELITPAQMSLADRLTIASGIPGIKLMENAGLAVAGSVQSEFPDAENILILCGTGNNGGDGFIVAQLLQEAGLRVHVYIFGDITRIKGDAELALARLNRQDILKELPKFNEYDLIIDGLLGAGLDRDVSGDLAELINEVNSSAKPVVSIDLPSGVDGSSGAIRGVAVRATSTVTFFRFKPGHLLMPGKELCGDSSLHQIGIKSSTLDAIEVEAIQNVKLNWMGKFPVLSQTAHKYSKGHTLVVSGPIETAGAARLAANAALRAGSGLVTLAGGVDELPIHAAHITSVMLKKADSIDELSDILKDQRFNCVVLGPGMPVQIGTSDLVKSVLLHDRRTVLDAGALSCFSGEPKSLFESIRENQSDVILTPHDGEFTRIFPYESCAPSKIERARQAAAASGATVLLKGPDTVVASPDGRISVSDNAPPWLATAGSGDVLAGVIAGLLAQGMPAFEATSAAVWIHGEAARELGPAMISSDLDEGLRLVFRSLIEEQG